MSNPKQRFRHSALWIAVGWTLVAVVVWLSLAKLSSMAAPAPHADKYAHVAAYAAIMFWFMQIYDDARSKLVAALGLCAMGIMLEFAQAWTGYRSFERADMVADSIGIALGWLLGPPRTANVLAPVDRSF